MENVRIAVIGAGISGITAARDLYNHGFRLITIFEASNRIGGRIHSVPVGDSWIELGAQWIHGQEENVLYEYARQKELISDPIEDHGLEGAGHFCTEDGRLIDTPLIRKLIEYLDEQKNEMELGCSANVCDYFRDKFQKFIEQNEINENDEDILESLRKAYRWFILFEVIDNSCDKLENLSILSYTEWQDCPGVVDLVNFKHCYHSILEEISKEFPLKEFLQLQTAVNRIEIDDGQFKVKLTTANNDDEHQELFDHVIITSSLGFLKENLDTDFFGFKLPKTKIEIIQALGFGSIEKIFLWFDCPFWYEDLKGFQMLWTSVMDTDLNKKNVKFPFWVYYIQGFDPVRNQPNMLMAWIGSDGAVEMNRYTDMEVMETLTNVLRKCVPRECRKTADIEMPTKLFWHRWFADRYIRGSYSNRTVAYEKLSEKKNSGCYFIDKLAEPITIGDLTGSDGGGDVQSRPVIMFAGEATDRQHYSTTHGAMKSGQREAFRLYQFYQ